MPPDAVYRERRDAFLAERDRCSERARRIGHARVISFLLAAALLILLPESGAAWPFLLAAAAALFIAFLGLVSHQNRLKQHHERLEKLAALNGEGVARLERRWEGLPEAVPDVESGASHPIAEDLDLFGRGSLFSLLSVVGAPGRETLAAWLLEPAPPGTIRRRQESVAELASEVELREEIAWNARSMPRGRPASLESFLAWAEGERWLRRRPGLLWTARLLPLLPLTLIGLNIAGVVSYLTWVFALAVTLTFSNAVCKNVHRVFDRAFSREGGFQEYAELIRLLEEREFESPLLAELRGRLTGREESAQTEMRRLHRLVSLSEMRFSMLYVAVQGLTLWDFHVLDRLEGWQLRAGRHVREWLGAVAEADALSALATLRFDNPGWAFPEIAQEGPPTLEASDLGHPLLRTSVRVANDVTIPPPGRFLFITGSNMSGKSTLLRAIGTNVVLAQAGAPVCASGMRLAPLSLATSMRVHDSLQAGLSHFMAELTRLKMIVEAARQGGDRVLLYLLDDILQGTNSAERRIAARKVIGHLLDARAIGCVTSHDLALADEGRLAAAGEAVHFTERIEEAPESPHISFDYRLRPGIATSRNALKLVELVGLSETERATGD
jgi:hypothetical protein